MALPPGNINRNRCDGSSCLTRKTAVPESPVSLPEPVRAGGRLRASWRGHSMLLC